MDRLTYVGADGIRTTGVAAVARALEHTNLAWSLVAWMLRLPGIAWFAQAIADAVGARPRSTSATIRTAQRTLRARCDFTTSDLANADEPR